MLNEHIKGLSIISSLLAIAGLVLMFSSISFGTALGYSWLLNQVDGVTDTSQYNMIVETNKNNFVITGSILFSAGILTYLLTYLLYSPTIRKKGEQQYRLMDLQQSGALMEQRKKPNFSALKLRN